MISEIPSNFDLQGLTDESGDDSGDEEDDKRSNGGEGEDEAAGEEEDTHESPVSRLRMNFK